MRHVGLETERLWSADLLEQIDHVSPAVHSAPADFSLRGQPLAEILGDTAGFGKCPGNSFGAFLCIFGPGFDARGGIDANDTARPDAEFAKLCCYSAGLFHHREEARSFLRTPHRRASADRRPYRRDHRPDFKVSGPDLVGQPLDVVLAGVD